MAKKVAPKWTEIFDAMPDLVSLHDADYRLVQVNKAFANFLGKKPEELVGKLCYEVVHATDKPIFNCPHTKSMEIQQPVSGEIEDPYSGCPLLVTATPIFDNKHKLIGSIHIAKDVSEYKHTKNILQRNSQLQGAINTILSISMQPYDLKKLLNEILAQIAAIPWLTLEAKGAIFLVADKPDQLVMQSSWNLPKEIKTICDQVPFGDCLCGRAAKSKRLEFASSMDSQHKKLKDTTPHGHYCVPLLSSDVVLGMLTLYTKAGHPKIKEEEDFLLAIANVLAGIIERKQAEENRLASEKMFRTYFQLSSVGMAITSVEKKWLHVNDQLCELLGYNEEELCQLTWAELTHPDDLEIDTARFKQMVDGKIDSFNIEKRYLRKNGTTLYAALFVSCARKKNGSVDYFIAHIQDITESKRAKEALQQNEKRFRSLVENIPGAVYRSELIYPWHVEHMSNYIYSLTGHPAHEFTEGKIIFGKLIIPDDVDKVKKAVAGAVAKHEPYEIEYRLQHTDGNIRWAFERGIASYDNGEAKWLDGLILDITERKHREGEIKLHEMRLQSLLQLAKMTEATTEELLTFALQEVIKSTQSKFSFIGLINKDETVMSIRAWSKVVMKECSVTDNPIHFSIAKAGIWTEAIKQRQACIINDYTLPNKAKKGYPAGHVPLTRLLTIPIFDGKRIVAVASVANKASDYNSHDVDACTSMLNDMWQLIQRKQTEETFRKNEERFRAVFEAAPVSIWEEDYSDFKAAIDKLKKSGVKNFRKYCDEHPNFLHDSMQMFKLIDVNSYSLKLFETTSKAKLLNSLANVFLPETFEIFKEELIAIAEGSRHFEGETVFRTIKGKQFDALFAIYYSDWESETNRAVVTLTDITARKQAEKKIQQTMSKLVRANKELEGFAYAIAHDLKEPLRQVSNYTELLAQQCGKQSDAQTDKAVAYIMDGTTRMYDLINDLMIYSQAGNPEMTLEPTNLTETLGQVLADLEMVIQQNDALITYDPLPTVTANPAPIKQLLQNIIANAIKFRGKATPHIHISGEQKDNKWVFSVRDNGIGIEKKFAKRIFRIFQRLHTREDYPGTGIGLAICNRIVEHLGGRIWVESELGKGATFYFTIPC